jgi:hypothetical protein
LQQLTEGAPALQLAPESSTKSAGPCRCIVLCPAIGRRGAAAVPATIWVDAV